MSKLPVILIVDDDELNLTMAKSIIEIKIQAEIITAGSGTECLEIIRQRRGAIDLILLDIAMPGIDGIHTLTNIRENPNYKNIKVIFLTAAADKNTIIKAGKLKVEDYIKKPFVPDDLISRVEKQLYPSMHDQEIQDIFKALDDLGL
ncbi:MAG: response regulator [Anaerovibrio sp.]|uniref:response regulator n=1 Tax=Anaerovibrio sp. TaxID=1872532 RepID=UPI0025FE41E9|nr:response regulator [Anaerovibrio sp.]MCR5175521.1 response regulator [Anaerovibrio sp.]